MRRASPAPYGFTAKHMRLNGVWCAMRQRCGNPKNAAFHNYGGRGITVCERWNSFVAFVEDMGEAPAGATLERRDNNGPYSPENCYWASRYDQCRNRRGNVLIEYRGETMIAEDWAKVLDIPARTICRRIRSGIPPHRALEMGRGRCRRGYSAPPQSVARVKPINEGKAND